MHEVIYTMRDALYTAGMLNAFHRHPNVLGIANLAQLVNVLPAIVVDKNHAFATPIYYPFYMYHEMQPFALAVMTSVPRYDSEPLGNIPGVQNVPYLDVTATRDETGEHLTLGVINRHPERAVQADFLLTNFGVFNHVKTRLLHADPLAFNSFEEPQRVAVQDVTPPSMHGNKFSYTFPASSVTVFALTVAASTVSS